MTVSMSWRHAVMAIVFACLLACTQAPIALADDAGGIRAASVSQSKKATKKDKAIKLVKEFMRYAKKYDVSHMKKLLDKPRSNDFFVKMRYMASYCKKHNKKLKYRILNTSASDNGDVCLKLEVAYRDGYEAFYYGFDRSHTWTTNWALKHWKIPSDRLIDKKIKHYLVKGIKLYGFDTTTERIDLRVVKSKGKWKIHKTKAFLNVLNLGYGYAYDSYWADQD